ncbi:LysR family transcriptional regulator [Xinfangfangia sp. CPCC 101601]|uniref:LysR family transcriptional regulator n=1 Tax=Pseudogemmobacter lacusdianii TaxID=3069608 RepID=A0ABU0W0D0_9RHOB|nr:LysR family transcriptional regulator [Xinfangfangia sp. CPCC 101601]MDQ2067458.1 LysR family transcriptional regulator [Xinfangfangia sp. CPCC 101601]
MCIIAQEVQVQNWDELRTAYQVARLGTVSGAAEVLGVHHATVIRHIDALESRLGIKLFQRHARGYTSTEAGRDLLVVAQAADEQFVQLANRIKGHGETVQGELIVTSIAGISDLLVPVLTSFQALQPDLSVRYLTDMRLFRLDFGEAHVAIRAGSVPEEPDNVVQPLVRMKTGLYAARSYVEKYGLPQTEADLAQHRFVTADNEAGRAPFHRWLRERVPDTALTFRTGEPQAMEVALREGVGIGFLSAFRAHQDDRLVEVMPPRAEWESPLWLVTHVDLHRTRKVQAFVAHLKEQAKSWRLCS